jgi:hypothetical protein
MQRGGRKVITIALTMTMEFLGLSLLKSFGQSLKKEKKKKEVFYSRASER